MKIFRVLFFLNLKFYFPKHQFIPLQNFIVKKIGEKKFDEKVVNILFKSLKTAFDQKLLCRKRVRHFKIYQHKQQKYENSVFIPFPDQL